MRNDIPVIESGYSFILLKTPKTFPCVSINDSVGPNISNAFVYNRTTLDVEMIVPTNTGCSGRFCDRQRIHDWDGSHTGCGCYGMLSNASTLAFQHMVRVTTAVDGELCMANFSSLKIQQLYILGTIPQAVKFYDFKLGTETMDKLLKSLEDVLLLINDNGGFTIIGWYVGGVIN